MNSSDLYLEAVGYCLEFVFIGSKFRKCDMYRGPQGSSKIGRARSDITQLGAVGKLRILFNNGTSRCKSGKHGTDVSSLLHRNDSELIFLVNPDKERLFIVMENASALGPVSIEATGVQESVSFLE